MSNYLRENEEWSQLLNNKTALYITGQTCDHEEYSILYMILSGYYRELMKNHIVFITDGNIKLHIIEIKTRNNLSTDELFLVFLQDKCLRITVII